MIDPAFIKFHQLPPDVKRAVTSPQAMQQLDAIEARFHVTLADVIVRLMVKELTLGDLSAYLQKKLNLSEGSATELAALLRTGILKPVLPYLEPTVPPRLSGAPGALSAPPTPRLAGPTPVRPAPPIARPTPQPIRPAPPAPARSASLPRVSAPAAPVPAQPPLPPRPPLLRGTAAYYISAEDEEEIAKHRDRLQRIGNISPTADLAAHIEGIIQRTPLPAAAEPMRARLRGLLLSRLRDVRTAAELRDLLSRPMEQGGMGYSADVVARLDTETEAAARTLHDRNVAGHLADPALARPSQPVAPPSGAPVFASPQSAATIAIPEPVHVAPKSGSHDVQPAAPQQPPLPPTPQRGTPPARPTLPAPPRSSVRRPMPQTDGRRMIQDIKGPDRPVGLVDELGMLTLEDFRTLGKDLQDSAAKVVEKIELLADESYEQRAAGVAAWRNSPVYQLYLAMGRESMAGNRPIDEIAADRRRRNLLYLTPAEFSVIADLNHHIRT